MKNDQSVNYPKTQISSVYWLLYDEDVRLYGVLILINHNLHSDATEINYFGGFLEEFKLV